MADTTYTDQTTVISADTMNDLNRLHYTIFSDPADLAAVKATLHAAPGAIGGTTPAAGSFSTLSASGVATLAPFAASYNYNSWNPSDLVGTSTAAASAGTAVTPTGYITLANAAGVLTVTFSKAGNYLVSVTSDQTHVAAYTFSRLKATIGGTATLHNTGPINNVGQDAGDTDNTSTCTFMVVATAGQTVTITPTFEVTGSGVVGNHTARCNVTALYTGT